MPSQSDNILLALFWAKATSFDGTSNRDNVLAVVQPSLSCLMHRSVLITNISQINHNIMCSPRHPPLNTT